MELWFANNRGIRIGGKMSRVVVVVVVIVVWCTVRGDWRIGLEIRARLKRSAGRRALCVWRASQGGKRTGATGGSGRSEWNE